MKKFLIYIIILVSFFQLECFSEEKPPEVGIVEKLDTTISMDLVFTDSDGKEKTLKEIIDKPTILALVYYRCPGICSPLLTEMGDITDKVDLELGKDFQNLSISFDAREGTDLALKWKKEYHSAMKNHKMTDDNWRFMTGDSSNIKKLTDAVGFYFKPDGKGDFIHAGALIVLDKNGKVIRYLLGTQFLPFDFKMSVIEASKGHSVPTVSKMLEYCFSYDPEGNTYVFNFTKVVGTFIFLGIGIFFIVLVIKGRKKTEERS